MMSHTRCFSLFIGARVVLIFEPFGIGALILYMVSLFPYMCGLVFLTMVGLLKWILIPKIEEGKVYHNSWLLRKWFLDRLFLSPICAFALERSLETTSTFPLFLKLLGVNLGEKVWLSYCSLRVGMELVTVEDNVHIGMQTYITTEQSNKDGVCFRPIRIGKGASW